MGLHVSRRWIRAGVAMLMLAALVGLLGVPQRAHASSGRYITTCRMSHT